MGRRARHEFLGRQTDAGMRRAERRNVFRILHEAEFAGTGAIERRDAGDAAFTDITAQNSARQRGDLLRCQPVRARKELQLGHATLAVAGPD